MKAAPCTEKLSENYFKYGVHLSPNCTVLDIGAGTGKFCDYILSGELPKKVIAVDPSPEVNHLLKSRKQDSRLKVEKFGVWSSDHFRVYCHYPNYPSISGFFTNYDRDHIFLQNKFKNTEDTQSYLSQVKSNQVQVKSLSTIIRDNNLDHIDLIKIDVRYSELEVLRGIHREDFKKIDQFILFAQGPEILVRCKNILSEHDYILNESTDSQGRKILWATRLSHKMMTYSRMRTRLHRNLVKDALSNFQGEIDEQLLSQRASQHDLSKYGPIESKIYPWIDWFFYCKNKGIYFELPPQIEKEWRQVKNAHWESNHHHPQSPENMEEIDLIEMVCDWFAIAQENGKQKSSFYHWIDSNIEQWKFVPSQKKIISNAAKKLASNLKRRSQWTQQLMKL